MICNTRLSKGIVNGKADGVTLLELNKPPGYLKEQIKFANIELKY